MHKNNASAETIPEVIIMAYQLFASRSPEEIRNMRNYFKTLPPYVQENFMQSGLQLHSEEEMRACAEKLMQQSEH